VTTEKSKTAPYSRSPEGLLFAKTKVQLLIGGISFPSVVPCFLGIAILSLFVQAADKAGQQSFCKMTMARDQPVAYSQH